MPSLPFPLTGLPKDEVLRRMRALREDDARWREGKTFSLVYFAGDEVSAMAREAYGEFMAENGLSPMAFPSLRRFEAETLAMCASLFHGDAQVAGTMTSGGTESVLMAVKTARDWAKAERGITAPEMVLPVTVHPAFEKAAHYFGVTARHAPVGPDFRADVNAMRALVGPHTVMVVGSAVAFPQGVVDPIADIAALAREKKILCHVDACLGGFILPFARALGRAVPPFDFEVEGVTSLSADLHKYGFAAKGASVVLYRDAALRRHQFFTYTAWPGGLYASPSMTGTRPGGAIAAAWAMLHHLGEAGYLAHARQMLKTTDALKAGVDAVPGLKVQGDPPATVFGFGSEGLDCFELGDAMEARGWKLDRLSGPPPGLHVMVTPAHARIVEPFLSDLAQCTAGLRAGQPAPAGSAALYGMAGAVSGTPELDAFVRDFLDGLYQVE
ncbi:MAG: aspartate aminotransferase family protein [Archangiaceae bacterium]|nr:aspartate aminotransferase family protein [Archangiaceae bacterium]